ncbi:amino acid adenylation domain-containing protein [Streptomyces sp. NPDC021093]|uniref:amino acid adenylation domain-containing protein n=1 Tax=Streptomyces sp. NPDC021093 TaxID=3365112 RepID=UPI00379278A5
MTLTELFAEQVARTPHATAVVDEEQRLTFAELDRRTDEVACRLARRGVGPDVLVGLYVERNADMVVGVLGILKAGGAYVPLDPAYPRERLELMAADSGAALVLTRSGLAHRLPVGAPATVFLDPGPGGRDADGTGPDTTPVTGPLPRSAAYLMYTSGSTGVPKGVVVEHRGLLSVFDAWEELYGLRRNKLRFVSVTSLSVDLFLADLLRSVFAGGTVVIAPRGTVADPARLLDLLESERADAVELVPSLAKALGREAVARGRTLPALKLLSVGSEGWLAEDCRELLGLLAPGTTVVNAYGATETPVDACVFFPARQDAGDSPLVPVGLPVPGTTAHVLDARLLPVAEGGSGELWIGGPGVARGYHGRPAETALRFVPDPWAVGGRLYRTGDLARRRPDGVLEFLGRADEQMKVRGHRVEPGEIENTLVRHPDVAAAAVAVRGGGRQGPRRLIGFLVPTEHGGPDLGELHDFLRRQLPEHLVPAALVPLDALPLLPNGKVDRNALPDAPPSAPADGPAPRDQRERALAVLWAEVLGVAHVGVHEDFFALGGDSVHATQLVGRIRAALAADLSVRTLLAHRTVAALARVLPEHPAPAVPAAPATPAAPAVPAALAAFVAERPDATAAGQPRTLSLSPVQQRLWFLHQYAPGADYNVGCAVRLTGPLDPEALDGALTRVVARHEPLRTTFAADAAGRGTQTVHPPGPVAAERTDLTGVPEAERERAVRDLLRAELLNPFDLSRGPLLRPRLVRLTPTEHILSLSAHHLVTDDWSYEILLAELGAHYTAGTTGPPAVLPGLPVTYGDHGSRQRTRLADGVTDTQLAYWKRQLAGTTPLELPTDRARTPHTGTDGARVRHRIPGPVLDRLRALAHARGATLFQALLTACQILFARHSGQRDIAVGTVTSGREYPELDHLIGFFVNTLVLRTEVPDDTPFTDLLTDVRDTMLDAAEHAELPFDQLVEALAPARAADRTPLVETLVVMRNAPTRAHRFGPLRVSDVDTPAVRAALELTVEFQESDDGLTVDLLYNTALFDRTTIQRLADGLETLLTGITDDPARTPRGLPLLTDGEQDRLLAAGRSPQEPADDACVHDLFHAQVRQGPDRIAVVRGAEQLSYAQLDARANRLAHHLAAQGVGPDVPVALCLDRDPELLVAALAVLKAGGAFVPLDPGQPTSRVAAVVADSGARVLVAGQRHLPRLPDGFSTVVCPDRAADRAAVAARPATVPTHRALPGNLAYAVYTSGSTGRPKGVLVPHAGIGNLAADSRTTLGLRPGARMLQHLSFAFDGGIWQALMPLLTGATVCMSLPEEYEDPALLARRIRQDAVTVLMLPPALLAALDPASLPDLELVCSAADVCSVDTARRWRAVHPFANLYGPTETTMCATAHLVARGPAAEQERVVPIGGPVRGVRHYVLDRSLNLVPAGVAGELYLAGAGLARGYRGSGSRTAERFVADPWGGPGSRMYRTGDLVRCRADGVLEFLGRGDDQVKIRGYRVETGEVTAALAAHPDLAEAVVTLPGTGRTGEPGRLTAYVVPAPGRPAPTTTALRRHLGTLVPDYMIPSVFEVLDAVPLTRHGKVDLRALPEPRDGRHVEPAYAAPTTPAEHTLVAVWSQVLGVREVGVDDDFFDLGGDSLTSVRLAAGARAAGLALTPKDVFTRPTVRALAQEAGALGQEAGALAQETGALAQEAGTLARKAGADVPPDTARPGAYEDRPGPTAARPEPVPPGEDHDSYPLTPLQSGLLYHSLAAEGAPDVEGSPDVEGAPDVYARRIGVTIGGVTDPHLLVRAWQFVVDRTPALRSTVTEGGGAGPVQRVQPRFVLPVGHHDWRGLSEPHRRERLAELEAHDLAHAPDPRKEVPLRLTVVRTADDEVRLLWTCHHLFLDGWSIAEVLHDVLAAHAALAAGRTPDLPDRTPFSHYVRWLEAQDLSAARTYWSRALAGFPAPTPLPYAGAPAPGHRPRSGTAHLERLEESAHRELQDFARSSGLTVNTLVQAAWALLLARHSGSDDVLFGATVAHRGPDPHGAESVIGLLINTLPVRIRIDGAAPVRDWLRRVQSEQAEARQYDTYPLPEQRAHTSVAPGTPLFDTAVSFDNLPVDPTALATGGLRVSALDTDNATNYPLSLLVRTESTLVLEVRCDSTLFDAGAARRLAGQLRALLAQLSAPGLRQVAEVALPAEHLSRTSRPAVPAAPPARCAHELFAEQAARNPGAPALREGTQEMSYAELERRANQLAHHLREHGVGPDRPVGLALPRGMRHTVALLAILKAGGAHLPLDLAHPGERLRGILTDTGAALLLTDRSTPADRCPPKTPVLHLDTLAGLLATYPATPPPVEVLPDHLAYIIHTSGSTGRPKGVAVTHRGVTGMLAGAARSAPAGPGHRVLQFAAAGFDAAFWETAMALFNGAALVLAPTRDLLAGPPLARTLAEHRVTHATLPPAVLAVLPPGSLPPGLVLFAAGEACPREVAARWAPERTMFNAYGPTEATVCATVSARLDGAGEPEIGEPVPGTGVWVLDERLRAVPDGVTGELHLSGQGLARGYVGRFALTAERFVASPYGPPGTRMYRTGDLVRRLPDGGLVFRGRADDQVKVRGFRVEPGEVERELTRHHEVAQAAVVAVGEAQGRRLVAHVVPVEGSAPSVVGLREHLARRLPPHLVPDLVRLHRALPFTANGKIDRRALETRTSGEAPAAPRRAARDDAERTVAEVWARLLEREADDIGVQEKFFEAGGTSLTLMQLAQRLTALGGAPVPVAALLEHTTVEAMAKLLTPPARHPAGTAPTTGQHTGPDHEGDYAL